MPLHTEQHLHVGGLCARKQKHIIIFWYFVIVLLHQSVFMTLKKKKNIPRLHSLCLNLAPAELSVHYSDIFEYGSIY